MNFHKDESPSSILGIPQNPRLKVAAVDMADRAGGILGACLSTSPHRTEETESSGVQDRSPRKAMSRPDTSPSPTLIFFTRAIIFGGKVW